MRVHHGERGRQLQQQQRQWHEESNRRVAGDTTLGKQPASCQTMRHCSRHEKHTKTHENTRKKRENSRKHTKNYTKTTSKRHRNEIKTTSERLNNKTIGITAHSGNRLGQKHCACMRGVVILLVLQQLSLGLGSYLEIEISFSTNKCAYVMWSSSILCLSDHVLYGESSGACRASSCLCHMLVKRVGLTWVRPRRRLVFEMSHEYAGEAKISPIVSVVVEGFSPKPPSIVEVNSPKWGDQSARHIESEPRTLHLSAPITQLSKQRFHHKYY